MKRFVVVLVCVGFLSLHILAQSGKATRPRIVAAPSPETAATNSPNQPASNQPPTLKGAKTSDKTSQPTTATTAPAGDETIVESEDDVIRVETNVVTIPVSVIDRDGRFISGLQKEDFQIFENGVEQKIEEFATVQQPFTVVLLIDVSPSTRFAIDEIHEAAIAFVNELRGEDKVMVIAFDERIRVLCQPTNNRKTLQNAIRQAQFGDGTSLYEAVNYVISRELNRIQGRKAVVLFTDGVDTTSRRATYQSTISATEEIDALFYPIRYDDGTGGTSTTQYPQKKSSGNILGDILGGIFGGGNVQIGGGGGSRSDYETGRRYLEELARNSGGRKFEANSDLRTAFSGIVEELRRQYSLGYYPDKVGQKGERRSIRIRVKRPNVVVRAKDSYVIGGMDKKFAGN